MLGGGFGSPGTVGKAVCNSLDSRIAAGAAVGSGVLGIIHALPCSARDRVVLQLVFGIRTGAAGVSAAVLRCRCADPFGHRDGVVPIFVGAVPAGAGLGSTMLGIIVLSPGTVGQTVACLFHGTVLTGSAGICSLMLCIRDALPCGTADTMGSFLRLAVITGGALVGALMLCSGDAGPCTVCNGVRSGFCSAVTAHGTGLSA